MIDHSHTASPTEGYRLALLGNPCIPVRRLLLLGLCFSLSLRMFLAFSVVPPSLLLSDVLCCFRFTLVTCAWLFSFLFICFLVPFLLMFVAIVAKICSLRLVIHVFLYLSDSFSRPPFLILRFAPKVLLVCFVVCQIIVF